MALWRRDWRGLNPVLVGSAALMLAACGATETISPSPETPTADISPNACNLLSDNDIAAAFVVPGLTGASPAPSAADGVTHVYSVTQVSAGGTKTVGQCVWTDSSGAHAIALVIPNTKLTALADYTAGATQVGDAYVQEGNGRGFVSIQHGSAVIAITLVLDTEPTVRTAHLADLIRAASGAPIPVVTPGAVASTSSSSSSSSAVASGPGSVVQGQTAAAKVQETDQLKYAPNSVSISAGQVLEWDNSGKVPHNVTFDAYASITSDTMNGGDTFQVKFTQPGTYQFHCTFHPGMDGQVTVK